MKSYTLGYLFHKILTKKCLTKRCLTEKFLVKKIVTLFLTKFFKHNLTKWCRTICREKCSTYEYNGYNHAGKFLVKNGTCRLRTNILSNGNCLKFDITNMTPT